MGKKALVIVPSFGPPEETKRVKNAKLDVKVAEQTIREVTRRRRDCGSPIMNRRGRFHLSCIEIGKKPIVSYKRPMFAGEESTLKMV
jgi:hypothetical protein